MRKMLEEDGDPKWIECRERMFAISVVVSFLLAKFGGSLEAIKANEKKNQFF